MEVKLMEKNNTVHQQFPNSKIQYISLGYLEIVTAK